MGSIDIFCACFPVAAYSVSGKWARWDSWSQCSQTCGGGIQRRERACADPAPENGGADCVGNGQEERSCADWKCPGMPENKRRSNNAGLMIGRRRRCRRTIKPTLVQ